MKNLFILIFTFVIIQSFAQKYGEDGYQEKRYTEAIQSLKNKEYENAALILYSVYRYKKNELGEIALKKSDSILPLAQQNIRNKIIGKWVLSKSGTNWGFEKHQDSIIKKVLVIDLNKFSFYDLNLKTNEMILTKSENSVFTKNKNMQGLVFDFVFSDNTLWHFYYDEKSKTLRQIMTGRESENGRSVIVCGNSEYYYLKLE